MFIRIYVRASTKEQNAERALCGLREFSKKLNGSVVEYIENESGAKLERPVLNKLLNDANKGDVLLVESVDRLSRLTTSNFEILKQRIKDKGLRLIVEDLPTTHVFFEDSGDITSSILILINNLLIDILATMARLDNDKRKERIKQGLERSGYKATGKKADKKKHNRINELLESGNLKAHEIAKAVDCGIATVYRVKKVKDNEN